MKPSLLFPAALGGIALAQRGAFNSLSNLSPGLDEILDAHNGTGSLDVPSLFGRQVQCPSTYPVRCANGRCCQAGSTCVSRIPSPGSRPGVPDTGVNNEQCSTHSSAPPAAVPMPPPSAAPKLAAAVSQTRTAFPRGRDVVMLPPRPAAATTATRPARHAATAAPPHVGAPRPVAEEAAATRAPSVARTWDAVTRGIYAAPGHVSRLYFLFWPRI
ncbi:hypothetical protein BT67DRAFT_268194 [Trichocladium antarcticum]|uniref:Uncharacterized protein n=1 Tax=Trichocladium antarcticum TaxID=1450529 RepID=A0AAN6ZEB8_9PEZI|nr:hypothetical protein BT67DRAFT_268194 [Trichocladium antarcticum]